MSNTNNISGLMLERYSRGNVSATERELIKAALESDTGLFAKYEAIKKSDDELKLLYPLEKLPRLAAVKDAAVPIPLDAPRRHNAKRSLFPNIGRNWSRAKKLTWGISSAAVVLCVFFTVFYFSASHNIFRSIKDPSSPYLGGLDSGKSLKDLEASLLSLPIESGVQQEILESSVSIARSQSTTTWHGTGYNPVGPVGMEGSVPPQFKGMFNLYGTMAPGASNNELETDASHTTDESQFLAPEDYNTSEFDHITDNPFRRVTDSPLSTFSIDVDTAGYAITRYFITSGQKPFRSSVRIEELINYFDYSYPPPADGRPFAAHIETAATPWNPDHLLARIAIKGREYPAASRPRVNLVFLLDVSGSMDGPNRLPLVISSMKMLVNKLKGNDKVSICVYAGAAGEILPPTSGDSKNKIIAALDKLHAGGSTAGGEGIQLAYTLARQNFDPGAVNRVILCTDGDFNVGASSRSELIDMITDNAKSGVYLTVLGFGMGNYRDGTLKQLASKGNGNYGYIDTIEEAQKILVDQLSGTLVTIAQDVKIQVEFNPANVGAYRLIGYENRLLRKEDFNDDTVDAGDIGAGHTVTAFYELIPPGVESSVLPAVDPLKYSLTSDLQTGSYSDELLTVKLRYKLPQETESSLLSFPVTVSSVSKPGKESDDFRFAASVAGFGMLLRDSPYKGNASYDSVLNMARKAIGEDAFGYRRGFLKLVEKAKAIKD